MTGGGEAAGTESMRGRVAVVTGATSGIGRAAARRLAARGATLVLAGRDRERGRAALDEVRTAGGDGIFVRADFADFEAVRALAREVLDRYDRLDVLVNNAGLSLSERRVVGETEAVFAVNHLAPYLLTHDLLARLAADDPGRVVVTASDVHRRGDLDLSDLALEDYEPLDAYARSKLANVLFTVELADRLHGSGVTANAFHPGFVPGSKLWRDTGFPLGPAIRIAARLPFVGTSAESAADGLAHLASSPAVADVSGGYFAGRRREEPDPRVEDAALRERLWRLSARLVGVDPDWPRADGA